MWVQLRDPLFFLKAQKWTFLQRNIFHPRLTTTSVGNHLNLVHESQKAKVETGFIYFIFLIFESLLI